MIVVRWRYENEDRLRVESFDTKAQAHRWIKAVCKPREGETRLLIVDTTGGIKIPASCKASPKAKSPTQLQREIDEALTKARFPGESEGILRRPSPTGVRGFKIVSAPIIARSHSPLRTSDLGYRDESQLFSTLAEAKRALPEIKAGLLGREALIVELR